MAVAMHDLVGVDFPLTQEFLAQMMGVRRTSVTVIAGKLQEAGLISYRRGHIQLLNIKGIRQSACDCHRAVQSHYERLFGRSLTVTPPT